ncbi:MAG: nitroreductase family protein [Bacteroidales bacterium]|jgi:nitroreductase|nr:nitroreductase family protein [Bacteroidales bacterium]
MDFLEIMRKRYSVRQYTGRKVERENLEKLLEAARVAPTAANRQPQRLIVVESAAGLEKLKRAAKTFDAPLAIIVCADHDESWKRPCDRQDSAYVDASIVTDHLMLEAASLELGSVWVMNFNPETVKAEFNIPSRIEPVSILMIGYPDAKNPAPEKKNRKPLSETVAYEGYGK